VIFVHALGQVAIRLALDFEVLAWRSWMATDNRAGSATTPVCGYTLRRIEVAGHGCTGWRFKLGGLV
jgi:hypothetical protein